MRALLDTHTFLWWNDEPERLPKRVFELITSDQDEIWFSAVTAWEIAIKHGKGKLDLPESPEVYVRSRVALDYFSPLPIDVDHAIHVASLPPIHSDPFDRLLVAQAQLERLAVLTSDPNIARYDVEVVW